MLRQLPWIKLVGWAIIIHVILLALSFIEVFIYSVIINPGQEQSFYEGHAQISAPYIAIIFGIPVIYFVARRLAEKHPGLEIRIGVWLAMLYIVIDLAVLMFFETEWSSSHLLILLLSFLTKLGSSWLGARSILGGREEKSN